MKVSINTAVFLDHLNNGMSQLESLKILDGLENEIDNIQVRGEFFDEKTKDQEIENIKKAIPIPPVSVYSFDIFP